MIKVGVTSQNFRTITGHAGKARRFIIYGLNEAGEVEELDRLDLPKTMSIHETIESSPHPLDELDMLVTGSGGDGFKRKMAARGVRVLETSASDPLLTVMSLAAGEELPPPSLGFDDDAEEGHGGCGCNCGH